MTMVSVHGEAAGLEGDKSVRGDEDAMQAMQPDARFLRIILFTLIFSTCAVGAVAGMATIGGGHDTTVATVADN
ncbi:MAG TPA: hypothetical protein ENK13_04405 [Thermopetrobacter sp.]|nr:hypothetical protein [Thermopetrobacter sp.]